MDKFVIILLLGLCIKSIGQKNEFLPPVLHWDGSSTRVIANNGDEFLTTAERSNFDSTATLTDTHLFFESLAAKYQACEVLDIGKTNTGYPVKCVLLSKELGTYQERGFEKPILLVQNGIHAGEIDGKDASMMWARDILRDHQELFNEVNVFIIPVLNVEGHERISPYNRMNQRGPANMGWRTNGNNLNLNRDYMKLETPALQSVIALISQYKPSLYLDIHVTDGADYQYDITYGFMGEHGYSPHISSFLKESFRPYVDSVLESEGHIPGPLLFAKNGSDFTQGNLDYTFNPDFSHAYGDVIGLPTILVENHSLKPFKQRVLGTYFLIDAAARFLAQKNADLHKASSLDQNTLVSTLGVNWTFNSNENGSNTNPWEAANGNAQSQFTEKHKGVAHKNRTSAITGGKYVQFTGQPIEFPMPIFRNNIAKDTISLPSTYIVPASQVEVIKKLMLHHIPFVLLEKDSTFDVHAYKFNNESWAKRPFEGKIKMTAEHEEFTSSVTIPAGSVIIEKKSEKFKLAALLLEPLSPSSLFQWGYFNTIFSRTEYIEEYVLEPYIQSVLSENTELKMEFEKKVEAGDLETPRQKREWFYRKSPFVDRAYKIYPIYKQY